MAALALNPKLQSKNRIRTEPRQQYGPAKKERTARQDGSRPTNIELLDSGRDQVRGGNIEGAFHASTSRAKITKDSQIKIIPVLRDLDTAKNRQADRYEAEGQGSDGLEVLHQEQRPQDDSVTQRAQKGAATQKTSQNLPKPKQKLNLLHNENQRAAK
jgi:hypothetical protein